MIMRRIAAQLRSDGVPEDLALVILTILAASKVIADKVNQGALAEILGITLQENPHGEQQKELDVIANDILKDGLSACPAVRSIASEEEENVVVGHGQGKYVIAFDPLDGSSNIEINGQIGTIFSIYPAVDGVAADSPRQFFRTGREQVCAGYTLYGPSTVLTMTTGGPSRAYTLSRLHCDYLLTHPQLSIPVESSEFAVNVANFWQWSSSIQTYVSGLQAGECGPRGRCFTMRWNGAMVGDVHRILSRGGIFLYPSNEAGHQCKNKLRLLYEASPLALITEKAGGKAIAGEWDLLDVRLTNLHQKVPVIIGSAREVGQFIRACIG